MDVAAEAFKRVYRRLHQHYGAQAWWPADDAFEVMVGAILTQNTSWTNVEKAIANLKHHALCDAEALAQSGQVQIAQIIRSSGYYNQKSTRLIALAEWYLAQGGVDKLRQQALTALRQNLLSINGVGDETADDILLYALQKPVFVIDAYTRRIFSRLGLVDASVRYGDLQRIFHDALETDLELFQQYHALIVMHAKQHCLKKPRCETCPLVSHCHYVTQKKS